MNEYRYKITGTAHAAQTWEASGTVHSTGATVMENVMHRVFRDLTNGKAVFGHPGVGCKGPYEMDKIFIERIGP